MKVAGKNIIQIGEYIMMWNVNVDFTSWYIHLFGLYFFLLPSYIYICVCVCVCVCVYKPWETCTKTLILKTGTSYEIKRFLFSFLLHFHYTINTFDSIQRGNKQQKLSADRGSRSVMVIVVGSGHGGASSNPGRDWWHFT